MNFLSTVARHFFVLGLFGIALNWVPSRAGSFKVSEQQAREQLRLGLIEESAETYARIGELLLNSDSVYYAQVMFEKALQIDSNNLRANFYSSFVGPLSQLRGFGQRTEEYSQLQRRSYGRGSSLDQVLDRADIDELEDGTIRSLRDYVAFGIQYPNTSLNRFLMEDLGKPKIHNHEQMRKFIQNELSLEMEKGLERLKKVSGKAHQLQLYLPNSSGRVQNDFSFSVRTSVGFKTECFYDNQTQSLNCVSLESAPVAIQEVQLQGALLAYDYYLQLSRILTAYNLEGYETISDRLANAGGESGEIQYRRFVSLISRFPTFLTLDSASKLSDVISASRSILTRLFEMGPAASTLCWENGYRSEFALCQVVQDFDAFVALEKLVQGEVNILMGYDARYQPVRITMNVPAWFAKPTTDLKLLFPRVRDLDQLPDRTLSGLFPNGDLASKIKAAVYSIPWQIE